MSHRAAHRLRQYSRLQCQNGLLNYATPVLSWDVIPDGTRVLLDRYILSELTPLPLG